MEGATCSVSPALLTPKDTDKPTTDYNKWFTRSNKAEISVTFKQKLSIDAIGFETGGDDASFPDRTPRTVRIGYTNNG